MTDHERRRHAAGYAMALGAGACVGFTPVASKILLRELHLFPFGAIWFGCAGLYAVLTLAARGRLAALHLSGRVFFTAAGVGVANGLSGLCFFRAVQIADPALVSFFTRPGTIFTVLGGIVFFGERMSRSEWLAVFVVVGGSTLLGFTASAIELRAFALVMGGTLFASVAHFFAKDAVADAGPMVLVAYRAWFTSATFASAAIIAGQFEVPVGGYLWVLPVGAFFGPFLSFALLFAAFHRLPLSTSSAAHAVNPLFTTVYAALLIGTRLTAAQLLGGGVATAGIVLLVLSNPSVGPPAETYVEEE